MLSEPGGGSEGLADLRDQLQRKQSELTERQALASMRRDLAQKEQEIMMQKQAEEMEQQRAVFEQQQVQMRMQQEAMQRQASSMQMAMQQQMMQQQAFFAAAQQATMQQANGRAEEERQLEEERRRREEEERRYAQEQFEESQPPDPVILELLAPLRSQDEGTRLTALEDLRELTMCAVGEEGVALGRAIRAAGGVSLLTWLLVDPAVRVQQETLLVRRRSGARPRHPQITRPSLSPRSLTHASVAPRATGTQVLANLCADTVDSNAAATKRALLKCGGARALDACLASYDREVVVFACGAVQNLCSEAEWCEALAELGSTDRLQTLLSHDDTDVVRFASGALQNIVVNVTAGDANETLLDNFGEEAIASVENRARQIKLQVRARATLLRREPRPRTQRYTARVLTLVS